MKWLEAKTQCLCLAVWFSDASAPGKRIGQEELRVYVGRARERAPLFHRSGYWLVTDVATEAVTISWEAEHYESGEQVVELGSLPRLSPVAGIVLTKPPPVTITLERLSRGRVGVPYRLQVTTSSGKPPLVFESFNLPRALVMNRKTGFIRGTPVEKDRRYVTLRVTDHNGTQSESVNRITIQE